MSSQSDEYPQSPVRRFSTISYSVTSLSSYPSTRTFSFESTVHGPGTLVGKAVLALGNATLRGVEKAMIWGTLARISSYFPYSDTADFEDVENMCHDLLELARYEVLTLKGLL